VGASPTIAVAMSGGVDSSVAAWLLHEQGFRVFGVTARMTQEYSRCCADEDVERAARMARQLGIEHHVVEVTGDFKGRVIEYFIAEYLAGRTPSPCVVCNREIKFGVLFDRAVELGATRLATGHYARLVPGPGGPGLARGVDRRKDQSYFLARLTAAQLARTVFPLGAMRKSDVVRYAQEHQLPARESRESQDICFVTEGTHGDYIDLRSFHTRGPGDIVDETGRKIGEHRGIHCYTVGQRKGLGIATGKPMYVVGIDAEKNLVRVGEKPEVMRREMAVTDPTWIAGAASGAEFTALCQVRYNHEAAPCRVTTSPDGTLHVEFDEPQFAITPGQLAAFYEGDQVLGGGWIEQGACC
jgi:tRNA-uridine 2-sulfurtransferase